MELCKHQIISDSQHSFARLVRSCVREIGNHLNGEKCRWKQVLQWKELSGERTPLPCKIESVFWWLHFIQLCVSTQQSPRDFWSCLCTIYLRTFFTRGQSSVSGNCYFAAFKKRREVVLELADRVLGATRALVYPPPPSPVNSQVKMYPHPWEMSLPSDFLCHPPPPWMSPPPSDLSPHSPLLWQCTTMVAAKYLGLFGQISGFFTLEGELRCAHELRQQKRRV